MYKTNLRDLTVSEILRRWPSTLGVFLDLNMPDMHGMEVIGFVRSHQAYREIPIVVLTTKGEESSRSEALAAGANRYLTKPFDPRQLADVVSSLLKTN